jgi:hypothetical protein
MMIKGGIAGVVILACIGWIIYLITSGGPTVIKPDETQPAVAWMKTFGTKQNDVYQQLEKVNIQPSADGKTVTISGSVKTAADLAKLKSTLEAIEPKAPLTWDVRVGQ